MCLHITAEQLVLTVVVKALLMHGALQTKQDVRLEEFLHFNTQFKVRKRRPLKAKPMQSECTAHRVTSPASSANLWKTETPKPASVMLIPLETWYFIRLPDVNGTDLNHIRKKNSEFLYNSFSYFFYSNINRENRKPFGEV